MLWLSSQKLDIPKKTEKEPTWRYTRKKAEKVFNFFSGSFLLKTGRNLQLLSNLLSNLTWTIKRPSFLSAVTVFFNVFIDYIPTLKNCELAIYADNTALIFWQPKTKLTETYKSVKNMCASIFNGFNGYQKNRGYGRVINKSRAVLHGL